MMVAMIERVKMTTTLELLDEVTDYVQKLDGTTVDSDNIRSKDLNKTKADISRQLLYAAHLMDLARAAVLNEYYKFKGENPPEIRA